MLMILSRFFLAKRRFFEFFDNFSRRCITNRDFNTTNDNLLNKTYIPSEKEELQRFSVLEPIIMLLSATSYLQRFAREQRRCILPCKYHWMLLAQIWV